MAKQSLLIPAIASLAILTVGGIFFANHKNQQQSSKIIDETVEQTAKFLIKDWKSDPALKDIPPPQVIPVISGSNIYGACADKENKDGITHWEIGGSAYCGTTHSIYLVPEQLKTFENIFGASSIAYVLAHEFGHAVQAAYNVSFQNSLRELQADCIAGVLIDIGNEELGITRNDVLSMAQAAYSIGSESHGTGQQRRYALLSGMGVVNSTCSEKDIKALANNEIQDPALKELGLTRSGAGSTDTSVTPYPKTINSALGI